MTIEYTTSRGEIASWYWRSLRRNPPHFRAWLTILLVVAIAVFVSLPVHHAPFLLRLSWSAGAVVLVAALLALYPQLQFKPQKRTLTVEPNGMSTTINGRSKEYTWADVASVAEERDHVIITLVNANAFLIPLRAFSSTEHQQRFVRDTQAWQARVRETSAA
jgi:hypothetical protein